MIHLNSSWEEILPKGDIKASKENWSEWLTLCRQDDSERAAMWSGEETCVGCIHYRPDDYWCKLQELPASFNPILTPKGYLGMACMGAGRQDFQEPKTKQEAMAL